MMEKKKKILVLASSFPRDKEDWWGRFVLNIYQFLPKDKFEITVLAPHAPGYKRTEQWNNIRVHRFFYFFPFSLEKLATGRGIMHSKDTFLAKIQLPIFIFAEFFVMFRYLNKEKFDLIHAHWIIPQGVVAALAKIIFKTPLIITVHGSDIFGYRKANFLKKFALKHANVCTVNSNNTEKAVKNLLPSVPTKLIPMGVDVGLFSLLKKNKKKKDKISKNYVLLAVGRLIECKGFIYLIRALPKILDVFPQTTLFIVGSGPKEEVLKKEVKRLKIAIGKNIYFIHNKTHKELIEMYASSDLCIAPSVIDKKTGEREGQGIVPLEAFASGVPAIGTKSMGLSGFLEKISTELLVKEEDSDELAKKIIFLLKNPEKRMRFAEKGSQYIRDEYSWQTISLEFAHLYDKI